MEIHILQAGAQLGPFSETELRQYLGEGLVSPADLATYAGMEDWQPINHVLAQLPPSDPADPASEPPSTMPNDASPTLEAEPAPPPAESLLPLTASQRTKRKLGKIVIQPILPLEATGAVSARKKNRTGKTALTLEPLRPTTSLPPITGFVPKEKKPAKTLIPPVQLSLGNFPEKTSAVPTPPPVAPPAPPLQPPQLPALRKGAAKTTAWKARVRRIPRAVIYAGSALALLVLGVIFSLIYFFSAHHETSPAPDLAQSENTPPAPIHIETQSPEAVPTTAADYSARGFARQAKGDLDGALADYSKALDLDPKDLQACYRRALARQAQGNWTGALADYNAILSLNPVNADAFSNRGFVKQAQGDMDGALADYNQALLINPKIPVAYYNEGLIKVQKGDLDGAIVAYNHALDLDPKMAIAYYNRGNAKNTEGNLDGAIADYTQALVLNPKIALAYCNRGFARQSKGDADGALADYAQAIALNPKMAVAFYNRGLIRVQKGDLDGAVADSTQAIDLDPKNGQAYCNRGLASLGKNNLDEALADLRKFCELAPRDSGADSARLYIWLISTQENPKGNADAELSTSLQNDWNSPPEDLSSKIAAFLLGHSNETALIANAASPDPSREPGQYCKVWYFAGMKQLLAGNTTAATTDFQKCVATQQKDFCEYIFAQRELHALDQNREVSSNPAATP